MREAQCVYVTVSENEGEIYFDGQTPAELKTYIKKMKWLKWERRLSDKGTGRDKWFLVADFSDKTDVDQYGINRNQRLVLSGKLNDAPSGRLFRADLEFLQRCPSL